MAHSKTSTALDGLFRPRSVAVIGASRREGAIGWQVVANLIAGGFTGPVYPVNPTASVVHSIPTYDSVARIPGPVDLAIIVVPADIVSQVVRSCAKKGVKGLVVITAGFREIGGEGIEREDELCRIARRNGMRIIGPNCMGIINTEPEFSVNASFAATVPPRGRVAMVSQSGALGEAILADATAAGLGVSMFASVGNRADVTAADLLEYWEHCDSVGIVLLYIESVGDPARFVEIARRVSRHKPILAVKSGRSVAGAAAAGSHTGSVAGTDLAVSTMFRQCGVLRVESFREMFSLAASLLTQPIPRGDRIAIVTNAGGPGILATDALDGCGLSVAQFAPATTAALRDALPREASVENPVDLIASADAERYRRALRAVVRDRNVDGLLVLFVSPIMIDAVAVAEAIVGEVRARSAGPYTTRKPVLACVMGRRGGDDAIKLLMRHGIPVFRYPEDAAVTMHAMVKRARLLRREPAAVPRYRVHRPRAAALLRECAEGWMSAELAERVLRHYGIGFAAVERVVGADAAVAAADRLGYPVVVKAEAAALIHKSEHRAVATGLHDPVEVRAAVTDLQRRLSRRFADLRIVVQAYAPGHRELLIGMTRDARYGPMFVAGLGGTQVEVLRDVAARIAPMDGADPQEMFDQLKGRALLDAFRGEPAVDLAPACETLLRLQQLVLDHPRITEVEINPFVAGSAGVPSLAVDARLRL